MRLGGKTANFYKVWIIVKSVFPDKNSNEGENQSIDRKKINTELNIRRLTQFIKEAQYATRIQRTFN